MTTGTRTAEARGSALRHNRAFRLLWMGQALSSFGSSMTAIALPLALLAAGHPITAVGALGTAVAVAGLAARLPAGVVSDRYPERALLIGCDVVRLVVVGALAVCAAAGHLPLWPAFAAVVVSSGAAEVFKPAQARLMRQVVSVEQLPSAVALNQARSYGAQIAGPAAAGLLTVVRPDLPFAVDAVTFLLSAVCIAAAVPRRRTAGGAGSAGDGPAAGEQVPAAGEQVPAAAPGAAAPPVAGRWQRFTAGWRFLAADPFLRRSTVFFSGLTVAFTATGTALLLGVGSGPGGAQAAGWAVSTAAAVGLAGSLAAPRLKRMLPLRALVAAGPAVAAVLMLASWLTGGTLLFVAGFSAMCLLVPVINAAVATIMATSVPEEVYGRVVTTNDFVVQGLQPCGPLLAGLLVSRSLPVSAFALGAAFTLLAALALTLPAPSAPGSPAPGPGAPAQARP